MSSTAPTPPANGHATSAQHAQGSTAHQRPGHRPAAGGAGADLFANLLSLLSAGTDTAGETLTLTARDSSASDGSAPDTAAADAAQNPLAALLGWPGAPAPLLALHPTAGTTASAGAAAATAATDTPALGALGQRADRGQDARLPGATPQATEAPTALATDRDPTLTPPDADTLAALGQLPTGDEPPARAAHGSDPLHGALGGARITAWRSTTTLAHAGPTAGPATPAGHNPPPPGANDAASAASAATSSLARHHPAADSEDDPLSVTAPGGRPTERTGTDAGPTTAAGTAAGNDAGGQGLSQDTTADGRSDRPADGQDAPAGTMASDDADTTPWGAQHLRHASVRVGEAGEPAIDIQLTLAGQEVQVAFQTDDAQTRAQLAQDAGAALGDLLQRSGIDLGSVSVGGQASGQQTGQHAGREGTPRPAPAGTAEHTASADTARSNAPAPRPRSDGSRPLDLFV